jgi:hypothetical protein
MITLRALISMLCAVYGVAWPLAAQTGVAVIDNCQGNDDTALLQSAIDAYSKVVIADGILCVVTSGLSQYALLINKSAFELELEHGATLKLADSQFAGSTKGYILKIGDGRAALSGIRISGPGTIDGSRETNPLSGHMPARASVFLHGPVKNIDILQLQLIEGAGIAIYVYGNDSEKASHIRILNNTLIRNEEGINFKNADLVTIRGNHILDTLVQDGIEPNANSEHWIVDSNLIEQRSNYVGSGVNPYDGATYGIITGNVIRGHADGIDLDGAAFVSVIGNIVVRDGGSAGRGILVKNNPITARTRFINIAHNLISGYWAGMQIDGDNIDAQGNQIDETDSHGIIWNGNDGRVFQNSIRNPNQKRVSGRGIQVNGGARLRISGNRVLDDQTTPTMQEAAMFRAGVEDVLFSDNELIGFTNLAVRDATGGAVMYQHNVGLTTEGANIASVPAAATFVTVDHGLDVHPDVTDISILPVNRAAARSSFWVSDVTDASFRINVDGTPGDEEALFSWSAECD